MTRVCIFGAGAIGGHLAVRLAAAGVPTSVVVRTPAHADAIRRDGLTLVGEDGTRLSAAPDATADPATLPPQDVVLVTLKAQSLTGAVTALKRLVRPEGPVVYFLNGIPWWYQAGAGGSGAGDAIARLDPGGRLRQEVGIHSALGGVAYSANAKLNSVTIRNESALNRFLIGEPDGTDSRRLGLVADTLRGAGIDVVPTRAIGLEIWRKLLGNMSNSLLACLTGLPGYRLAADPGLRQLYARLFAEGKAVAAALGHVVADTADDRLDRLGSIRHRTSMLQDLDAGRPVEMDAQLFAVQDLARMTGTPTPVLDTLLPVLAAAVMARTS